MKFIISLMLMAMLVCGTAEAVNLGVNVTNFAFTPNSTTIAPTDTVTWTRVIGTHNVHNTSTPVRFHSGTVNGVWTTYVWPCTTGLGAYPYMCQLHTTMTGTVNVARITVTAPNGGENWITGIPQNITWTNSNLAAGANVILEINRTYPGGTWETIIASTPNDGTHSWVVSGAIGATNRIRVRAVQTTGISGAILDESNANFTISAPPPPVITLTTPNGGESWAVGSTQNVFWFTENFAGGSVVIELNRTFPGGVWESISAGSPDVGFQDFTVAGPPSTLCRVRVSKLGDPTVQDVSEADFTISATEPLVLFSPNGGETFFIGGTFMVNWSFTPGEPVDVELNRDFPGGSWELISSDVTSPPDVTITAGPASSTCRVRITDATGLITDESDADFVIADPTPPQGLVIYPTAADARMSWAAVPGAVNYNVYRSTDASLPIFVTFAGATTDTFFVDFGIVSTDPKYFYQVRAIYP